MLDAIGDHDIFKLISLRGSQDGMAIDPSEDGIELRITEPGRGRGPINIDRPSDSIRRTAQTWKTMTSDELHGLPWAKLHRPLTAVSLAELLVTRLELDHESLTLEDYGRSDDFMAEYAKLATSWLRLKLKLMWGIKGGATQRDLDAHVPLVRTAHVIRRLAQHRLDSEILRRVAAASVVLPRVLRSQRRAFVASDTGGPRKQREDRRRELAEAKRSFVRLETSIVALEAIQRKVHATLVESSQGHDGSESLDGAFYAALNRRLNASERKTLSDRISVNPARRPALLWDLVATLATSVDVGSANLLCSKIHVFEQEAAEDLPKARTPQPGDRPSIRALGWGDLVVVRERLVGYEARELSHIENVLAGEEKTREHERTHRTEELVETETIDAKESERDLQTSDRFELQAESQKTIETQFSVAAGINTSGRYGLTSIDTSLDAGFQRNVSESQHQTTRIAQEIVARSIEKVQQSVRELRRRVTVEEMREFTRHSISNTSTGLGGSSPQHRVGLYYWVEKIHELELRQYGSRLMIEFHIPEPGVTLLDEGGPPRPKKPKPADLAFGPQDISPANYMCLTQRYGADDVEPAPPLFKQVGLAWASEVLGSSDATDAEDTVAKMVKIPEGYAPTSGRLVVTGRGRTNSNVDDPIHAQVSIAGLTVLNSASQPRATYIRRFTIPALQQHQVDNEGLPVSVRIAGHDDRTATVNLAIVCSRTAEAYQSWQLATYEKIRAAHAALVRDYEEASERLTFEQASRAAISRPTAQNRKVERDELEKWAIKILRVDPFDFDAIVDEEGVQEIDPVAADEQAPVTSFFEQAFEWREMSYFLHPYFWGRRAAWSMRNGVRVESDPQHEAFIRAGSARVIVPVTPGYEDRVLGYLDSDPTLSDLQRIPPPKADPPEDTEFPDLWLELLLNRNDDLALGDGTLSVVHDSVQVSISVGRWRVADRDIGRELHIGGSRYEVAGFDPNGMTFQLDRPYEGASTVAARYAAGSVPFGEPWLARIPTALVVLSDRPSGEAIRSR